MAGYDVVADRMAQYPEVAIFRRFRFLHAKMLLLHQAELVHLEDDLQAITEVGSELDKEEDPPIPAAQGLTKCWKTSRESVTLHAEAHNKKVWEIQSALEAYYASVQRWNEIQAIAPPASINLQYLRNWMLNTNKPLEGTDSKPWRESPETELMVLSPKADKLDNWLCEWLAPTWHRLFGEWLHRRRLQRQGEDPEAQDVVFRYDEAAFVLIGNIACVVLSTALLTSAVIGLYYIHSMLNRLIFIAVSTLLFAVVLMFVAHCRRVEVFGGTAAFCAVLVVFLQNIPQGRGM